MLNLIIAILGGVLPAILWLFFWLKEDEKHPEPNKLIIKTFVFGMLAVPVSILFQLIVSKFFLEGQTVEYVFKSSYLFGIVTLVLWAGIEELTKYIAAYKGGLETRANDEAVDSMMYLITSALGFSALENTLFILNPLMIGESTIAVITGNMRFIGATLLHVATSAVIGVFIAFSYRKIKAIKKSHLFWGFVCSISLHTIFNSFIIRAEKFTLVGFSLVWLTVIFLILIFEKVKKII